TTDLPRPADSSHTVARATQASFRYRRGRAAYAKWAVLLIVALAVAGAGAYWYVTGDIASTDDAYTEGRAIAVAPQVAGAVVALRVTDNQPVRAGDILVEIDQRAYLTARDRARGHLDVARAELEDARVKLEWTRETYPARLAAAQASLAAARAGYVK